MKMKALTLLLESLYKPDSELRTTARKEDCYDDLMFYRDECIKLCKEQLHSLGQEENVNA